jgi:hypothetical protein
MTMHYHGTPITPVSVLNRLAGSNFCVSYAAPGQIERCHQIGQSVMIDNGAFSFWNRMAGFSDWDGFANWARPFLHTPTTWAVIPDVIDGSEEDNDQLITWLYKHHTDVWRKSAPVWHMHESLDRLRRLCHAYDKVCIGSSAQFKAIGSPSWHRRMEAAMNAVCDPYPRAWLHMLRGMAFSGGPYPFASVDSTDVARNHNRNGNDALEMARRWESRQCPSSWVFKEQLGLHAEGCEALHCNDTLAPCPWCEVAA